MPYQINRDDGEDRQSGRSYDCSPAFHNTETQVGKEIFEKFGWSRSR
jgi:hypothetical protein